MFGQEFLSLLDASPDALLVLAEDGCVEAANARAEALFGYPPNDLKGRFVEDLIPERYRTGHPGRDRKYFVDRPHWAAGNGRGEVYGLRLDGVEFPAEVSLNPLVGHDGTLVVAAIRDGTARHAAEDSVRRLLDAAPDAMVITNASGEITLVNAQTEALFGYPRAELLGEQIELLMPERFREEHLRRRERYLREAAAGPTGVGGLALVGRRRDGTEFPAEISVSPLESESGHLSITAIRDMTERARAEEQRARLDQAQEMIQMRDQFLSVASHELKTPLTALQLQVDSLFRVAQRSTDPLVASVLVERTSAVSVALERMTRLVNQLLDVTRITAGRLTLEPADVDLNGLVGVVIDQFRGEARRSQYLINFQPAPAPVKGRWDALLIDQVVTNLMSNALKYGAGKPIDVIIANDPSGTASVSVRDRGIGIAPEDQQRIFERFERVAPKNDRGGFGLGLWIVRQIVDAHDGRIRVQSAPGVGSLFTVELPRELSTKVSARKDLEGADADHPPRSSHEGCVMLVDDDLMIRDAFESALREEGVDIVSACNGLEALELLRGGLHPKIIFLDLTMPVMDGPGFLRLRREIPGAASVPVVLLSASRELDARANELGVDAFIKKPVKLDPIFAAIHQLGSQRPSGGAT